MLQGDSVRFLELVEQVEDGGHHGGHGEAWGGFERGNEDGRGELGFRLGRILEQRERGMAH
jgi:hypothetical protein